jgi:uncharacterized glyoxalase superfamily protein PhnB
MKFTMLSLIIAALGLVASQKPAPASQQEQRKKMKITPVLIVKKIEESLPFWVDRMGFQKTVEVPDGNVMGFAILVREGAELMFQTINSVRKDVPAFAPKGAANAASLFVEVDDFNDVRTRLKGYPIAVQERETFYGMREIGVVEPSGHQVIFAAPLKK